QRGRKILFGLPREAHDEVAAESDVGTGGAHLLQYAKICVGAVTAVHRLEDAVRSRLHREVEVRHQLLNLAVSRDERVVHVGGMAGRVTDARKPIDLRQCSDELSQAARAISPSIHILPEQDDLTSASVDQ